MFILLILVSTILLLLLFPDNLFAWGPSTHIYVASRVLDQLALLPPAIQALLQSFPRQYLYGCLSADITIAKKYARHGRNCHKWTIGKEILAAAQEPQLEAFALGYLSHLAADTISHNYYVPYHMVAAAPTSTSNHVYWECRMDSSLDQKYFLLAKEIGFIDHPEADALLNRVLTRTIFSFNTNKRIYKKTIKLATNEKWREFFDRVNSQSNWELQPEVAQAYLDAAFYRSIDFLKNGFHSFSCHLDPTGEKNLKLATRLRRSVRFEGLKSGRIGSQQARAKRSAEILFALPKDDHENLILAS